MRCFIRRLLQGFLVLSLLLSIPAQEAALDAKKAKALENYLRVASSSPAALEAHLQKFIPRLVAATVTFGPANTPSAGSGVIIDPNGLVLTAAHCTQKPGERYKVLLADGRTVDGVALGLNHGTDAGMLQLEAPGPFPFRPAIEEKTYEVGDLVIAVGQPGGPYVGRPPVVRLGRINRAGTKSGFNDPIQSTCTVISGDSGGPLFDLLGRVIGIHSNIQMGWTDNQHVPLPCFRTDWQDMLDNKEVGGMGQAGPQLSEIDDPFKDQREKALRLLAEHEPEAEELIRPMLRPPHAYAGIVDRYREEPPQNPRRRLGLHLDLTARACRVDRIVESSPADRAGLKPGDQIVAMNDQPISSPFAFASLLNDPVSSAEAPISLTVKRGKKKLDLEVGPELSPRRQMLKHPYADAVQSMVTDGPSTPIFDKVENAQATFLANLPEVQSLEIIEEENDDRLAFATAVDDEYVVTKLSEIKKHATNAVLRVGKEEAFFDVVASDKDLDLALLHLPDAEDLLELHTWSQSTLETGRLVLSPQSDDESKWRSGIVTQPMRPAPKVGYDHRHIFGSTPAFVGIQFSDNEDKPTVIRVISGSPADLAGVVEGDLVKRVGNTEVEDADAAMKAFRGLHPGQKVKLSIQRGDESISIPVTIGRADRSPNRFQAIAKDVDGGLLGYSLPDKLSKRRQGFPDCIYHDTLLTKDEIGGPIYNTKGQVVGVNIARSLRHRSLALPAATVLRFVAKNKKR